MRGCTVCYTAISCHYARANKHYLHVCYQYCMLYLLYAIYTVYVSAACCCSVVHQRFAPSLAPSLAPVLLRVLLLVLFKIVELRHFLDLPV